jgi:predicted ATPase
MAAGHGGQVLVSAATAAVVGGGGLTDLGEHQLRDLAEPQRVFQVGNARFPPLRALDVSLTNLAGQPTSLVGRQSLIAEVAALVESCPLVTLTGVGGVGKTRLAIEAGAELLPKFPDGVWLVDLAPVAHDDLVLRAVADVLGVATHTGEPLATTLISRLRSKRLLIILDNCEHVLGQVTRFAQQLLASAPDVRLLATSREGLGLAGERVRPVPPLAEETEAVELFVERARSSGASVEGAEQLDAIADICTRLDGLPLAIELAAARARLMTPVQIAQRLDQRFRLLTGGGRTAVERHRTLQATVAWSYELLDPLDQAVFQWLSTMAATFDLEAAGAIASAGAVGEWEVIDALGRLVDKSLVVTVEDQGGRRYRLLETLRQFGGDRLAEQPDVEEIRDRCAQYWKDRAVTLREEMHGPNAPGLYDAIDADIENYRAAFLHLLSGGRIDDAARGLMALDGYLQTHRPTEWLRWCQHLTDQPTLDPLLRLQALTQASLSAATLGDTHAGERYATEAIATAAALGVDPPAPVYTALLFVADLRHDLDACRVYWQKLNELARASGLHEWQVLVDSLRFPAFGDDEMDRAVGHYEQLLPQARVFGDPGTLASTALHLCQALFSLGSIDRANEVARLALDAAEDCPPPVKAGTVVVIAAYYALSGDRHRATYVLSRGLQVATQHGVTRLVLQGAFVAAALAAARGDYEATAVLLEAARRHADPLGIVGQRTYYRCRMIAETAIAAQGSDLTAARATADFMAVNDLTDYAMQTLEERNEDL